MASGEPCGPGCPTHNGDGAGTEDAYSPGGDPLCPSWGSDAPQGHFGGLGWIPAIYQRQSLMATYSSYLALIIHGTVGEVATGLRPKGSVLASWDASSTMATQHSICRGTSPRRWPDPRVQSHVKSLLLVVSRDDDADRMRAATGRATPASLGQSSSSLAARSLSSNLTARDQAVRHVGGVPT